MAADTTPVPTDALLPCPFCGAAPTIVERPDNIDGTEFVYAFACYCGGYSACAHKMAVRKTPELAKADAIAEWNRRAQPAPAASPAPLTDGQADAIAQASFEKYCGRPHPWEGAQPWVIAAIKQGAINGIKEQRHADQ